MRKDPSERRTQRVASNVTESEYSELTAASERAGLSLSNYIRRVSLGHRVPSREDSQARRELLKVNADLGRLGGLLKQALAAGQSKEAVYALLHRIDQAQRLLAEKIRAI